MPEQTATMPLPQEPDTQAPDFPAEETPYRSEELYNLLIDRFHRSVQDKQGLNLMGSWDEYEKFYDNRYWENVSRPKHLTKATSNLCQETVETMLPVFTSRAPRPEVTPEPSSVYQREARIDPASGQIVRDETGQPVMDVVVDPETGEPVRDEQLLKFANAYASGIERELIKLWHKTDMDRKYEEGAREHLIKGNMILKSTVNPEAVSSDGQRVDPEHPQPLLNDVMDMYTAHPDVDADSLEDCEKSHFIHAPLMTTGEFHRRYGVEIEPAGDLDAEGNFSLRDRGKVARVDTDTSGRIPRGTGDAKEGYVQVIEIWMHDLTLKDMEDYMVNDDGFRIYRMQNGENIEEHEVEWFTDDYDGSWDDYVQAQYPEAEPAMETTKVPKYPYGRLITIVKSEKNRIFEDTGNPYQMLPFVGTANYKRANSFWGTSELKNIESHARIKNQVISNINDNIRFFGNPIWERVIGSGVKEIHAEPGKIIDTLTPHGFTPKGPQGLPGSTFTFLEYIDNDADRKTGLSDAFRGFSDPGDPGIKTQLLIQQATGRLMPHLKQFQRMAKRLYTHWTSIIQRYWPDMVVQEQDDEQGKTFEEFNVGAGRDLKLRVDVSALSILPFDNYGEYQEAVELFNLGASVMGYPFISPEHLLEIAPTLRDKERAKRYIAQWQEQQAQQQQAMNGQGGVPAMEQIQQAMEQLGVPPEDQEIVLSGGPEQEEEIRRIFQTYPELEQLFQQLMAEGEQQAGQPQGGAQ